MHKRVGNGTDKSQDRRRGDARLFMVGNTADDSVKGEKPRTNPGGPSAPQRCPWGSCYEGKPKRWTSPRTSPPWLRQSGRAVRGGIRGAPSAVARRSHFGEARQRGPGTTCKEVRKRRGGGRVWGRACIIVLDVCCWCLTHIACFDVRLCRLCLSVAMMYTSDNSDSYRTRCGIIVRKRPGTTCNEDPGQRQVRRRPET